MSFYCATGEWMSADTYMPKKSGQYLCLQVGVCGDLEPDILRFYVKGDELYLWNGQHAVKYYKTKTLFGRLKEQLTEHVFIIPEDGFWYEDMLGNVQKISDVVYWAEINIPDAD